MKFSKMKPNLPFTPESGELSFQHLQAEMSRIDILIRQAVRKWQLAGQNPADSLRGLYLTPENADALTTRRFGSNWGDLADLEPDEKLTYTSAYQAAESEAQALVEVAHKAGFETRLGQLARAFHLDSFEVDALLICLAPALDLHYEQLYGFLQDDVTRRYASINLILDLLHEARPDRLTLIQHFSPHAPLLEHQLLQQVLDARNEPPHLLSQMLRVDDAVVSWLLGHYQPAATLGTHATLATSNESAMDTALLAETVQVLESIADSEAIIIFHGPDQLGQLAATRYIARHLNRAVLTVDIAAAINTDSSALQVVCTALRDARITGALACLANWDAVLSDDAPPPAILEVLYQHPDRVIVQGTRSWEARQVERTRNLAWVEFPIPDYQRREQLWLRFTEHLNLDSDEQMDIETLAGQFALTPAQIRDAVATAVDTAIQHRQLVSSESLFAAARAQSSPALGNLARKIAPRYNWHDIVLPDDQVLMLRELVATVRGRALVLGQWGLARKLTASEGVTALFAGPPGTGKTMAAEVVAAELGLDLYKIDLSTIVSKYIGETEKNLDRIFSEAESSNAILFFDEADAIFGKRSEVKDAHDRYANIEVSYLLQRMEAYNGVTILATNLRANLDDAFTRRLQFAIDFPFPDEAYRLLIWKTLFPPEVPRDESVDFSLMARRFRLAGGNIRNIIVNAAYQAASNGGKVTMAHLMHGTRRELQKMGRLLNEKDLGLD